MLLPFFRRSARSSSMRDDTEAAEPPVERRRFQRSPVRTPVTFRNLSRGGAVETACVEDVSKGGLLLVTKGAVNLGDAVSCELESLLLMGEVVHYRSFGPRQVIGVKLAHNLEKAELETALDLFWKHNDPKT